jgi:hypothetical protein
VTIARYAFLPWLRRGVANEIETPAAATSRAALTVKLTVGDGADSAVVSKAIQLVGPGDVLGINPQEIVRTEPRAWVTDFEPNYFAFVEFYDEDFPWRYTPAPADLASHRLVPWLSLFVLKEHEFKPNRAPGRPLFSFQLTGEARLEDIVPPDAQVWAWAHAQISGSVASAASTTMPDLDAIAAVLAASPDKGLARVMSPRRLDPGEGYHAFLGPTFEAGRLAGLGQPVPGTQSGLALSWATGREFPIYFEWFFRTGERGDFEELVRRLKPRDADPRVGIRDMDVREPGFDIGTVTNPPDDLVGLEGALVAPTATPRGLRPGSNLPPKIEAIVNAPVDLVASGAVGSDDPVVAPPLYGRWHALVERLDTSPAARTWVNELNGDPRYRAAAGLGTLVVQTNQESYMKLAWQQIGEVLAANRKIAFSQLSMFTSRAAFVKHLVALPATRAIAVVAPVFPRVLGSATTLRHQIEASRLPPASLGGAFRKLTRPRGLVARRAFAAGAEAPQAQMVAALNEGRVTAAPPRPAPTGATLESASGRLAAAMPEWLRSWLEPPWLLAVLVAALVLVAVAGLALAGAGLPAIATAAILGAAAAGATAVTAARLREQLAASQVLAPAAMTAAATAAAPVPAQFALRPPGVDDVPAGVTPDAASAVDFRQALIAFNGQFEKRPPPATPRLAVDLANAHAKTLAAIDPVVSHPKRVARVVSVGGRTLLDHLTSYHDAAGRPAVERIAPVMGYPDIKTPMYEPLRDISAELLVPNLDLIETNTLSILVTNQRFIESYLVGVNHEFAHELLWREYPTDQRGSSFRQFWDVSAYVDREGLDAEALARKLKDIIKLHEWATDTRLGRHDNRAAESADGRVVLTIRGDLLKRYPNTIIYAQRAKWGPAPARQNHLVLWDETGEISEAQPDDDNIRFPLFKAEVKPDLHFVGFNLTLDEVRGDKDLAETAEARAAIPANRLGWFFVIKEVVGEPRFGLDESLPQPASTLKWDNLAWEHLGAVKRVDFDRPFVKPLPGSNPENLAWGGQAADVATILYQKPVLVAVHAREMLKALKAPVSPWPD